MPGRLECPTRRGGREEAGTGGPAYPASLVSGASSAVWKPGRRALRFRLTPRPLLSTNVMTPPVLLGPAFQGDSLPRNRGPELGRAQSRRVASGVDTDSEKDTLRGRAPETTERMTKPSSRGEGRVLWACQSVPSGSVQAALRGPLRAWSGVPGERKLLFPAQTGSHRVSYGADTTHPGWQPRASSQTGRVHGLPGTFFPSSGMENEVGL